MSTTDTDAEYRGYTLQTGNTLTGMPVNEQIDMLKRLGEELAGAYTMIERLQVKADAYDTLRIAVRQFRSAGELPSISSPMPQHAMERAQQLEQARAAHRDAIMAGIDADRKARAEAAEAQIVDTLAKNAAKRDRAAKRAATIAAKKAALGPDPVMAEKARQAARAGVDARDKQRVARRSIDAQLKRRRKILPVADTMGG